MSEKRLKKLIRKYFRWWLHWTGLGYWNITLQISGEQKQSSDGGMLAGHCDCSWKYLTATITIYLPALEGCTPAQIEKVIIHELVHVLINEMREGDSDHEERVVTQLQKAFSWVKEGAHA